MSEVNSVKTILFVENDPVALTMYQNRLQREGFHVETAHDGLAALKYLSESPPDVVVLDLMLPRFSGTELFKFMRKDERLREVPVVIFSNAAMTDWPQDLSVGTTQCLPKTDSTFPHLLQTIKHLIAEAPVPPNVPKSEPTAAALAAPLSATAVPTGRAEFVRDTLAEVPKLHELCLAYIKMPVSEASQSHLTTLHQRVQKLSADAGQVGCTRVGMLAHAFGELLSEIMNKPSWATPSILQTMAQAVDCLRFLLKSDDVGSAEPASGARVLAVDDDPVCNHVMVTTLKRAGFDAASLESPLAALELLERNRFDLVLLDVNMPDLTGFELCLKLRRLPHCRTIPVIFVTAFNNFENRKQSVLSGGDDFITKPISPLELALKVTIHMLKAQVRREAIPQPEMDPVPATSPMDTLNPSTPVSRPQNGTADSHEPQPAPTTPTTASRADDSGNLNPFLPAPATEPVPANLPPDLLQLAAACQSNLPAAIPGFVPIPPSPLFQTIESLAGSPESGVPFMTPQTSEPPPVDDPEAVLQPTTFVESAPPGCDQTIDSSFASESFPATESQSGAAKATDPLQATPANELSQASLSEVAPQPTDSIPGGAGVPSQQDELAAFDALLDASALHSDAASGPDSFVPPPAPGAPPVNLSESAFQSVPPMPFTASPPDENLPVNFPEDVLEPTSSAQPDFPQPGGEGAPAPAILWAPVTESRTGDAEVANAPAAAPAADEEHAAESPGESLELVAWTHTSQSKRDDLNSAFFAGSLPTIESPAGHSENPSYPESVLLNESQAAACPQEPPQPAATLQISETASSTKPSFPFAGFLSPGGSVPGDAASLDSLEQATISAGPGAQGVSEDTLQSAASWQTTQAEFSAEESLPSNVVSPATESATAGVSNDDVPATTPEPQLELGSPAAAHDLAQSSDSPEVSQTEFEATQTPPSTALAPATGSATDSTIAEIHFHAASTPPAELSLPTVQEPEPPGAVFEEKQIDTVNPQPLPSIVVVPGAEPGADQPAVGDSSVADAIPAAEACPPAAQDGAPQPATPFHVHAPEEGGEKPTTRTDAVPEVQAGTNELDHSESFSANLTAAAETGSSRLSQDETRLAQSIQFNLPDNGAAPYIAPSAPFPPAAVDSAQPSEAATADLTETPASPAGEAALGTTDKQQRYEKIILEVARIIFGEEQLTELKLRLVRIALERHTVQEILDGPARD